MIGNDIVDLKTAKIESNWRRRGYLDKVFTISEQEEIAQTKDQDRLVWRLWSMKESAYKIYSRAANIRKYNPIQFNCEIEDKHLGFVSIGDRKYYSKTYHNAQYIATEARVDFDSNTVSNISLTLDKQSQKNELLQTFAIQMSINSEQLQIRKDTNGIPSIYKDCQLFNQNFSLSHHGRFCYWLFETN